MTAVELPLAAGLWHWDWDQEIGSDRMAAVPALNDDVRNWLSDRNFQFSMSLVRDPAVTAFVDLDVLNLEFEDSDDAAAFKAAWWQRVEQSE